MRTLFYLIFLVSFTFAESLTKEQRERINNILLQMDDLVIEGEKEVTLGERMYSFSKYGKVSIEAICKYLIQVCSGRKRVRENQSYARGRALWALGEIECEQSKNYLGRIIRKRNLGGFSHDQYWVVVVLSYFRQLTSSEKIDFIESEISFSKHTDSQRYSVYRMMLETEKDQNTGSLNAEITSGFMRVVATEDDFINFMYVDSILVAQSVDYAFSFDRERYWNKYKKSLEKNVKTKHEQQLQEEMREKLKALDILLLKSATRKDLGIISYKW